MSIVAIHADRSPVVVSLTTIPSRLPFIDDTHKSLMRQTRAPARILLNLPKFSKREAAPYLVPEQLRRLKSVEIVECEDWGPATKIIPSVSTLPADQMIVVVDDDRIYAPNLIADLESASLGSPEAAFGMSGWIAPADLVDRPTTLHSNLFKKPPAPVRATRLSSPLAVDILQGLSGYLVKPRFFDSDRLTDYTTAPASARLVDDVWISGALQGDEFVVPARRTNFQAKHRSAFYKRTSLGRINRGDGDHDSRNNTVMLKHFADVWSVGGRHLEH